MSFQIKLPTSQELNLLALCDLTKERIAVKFTKNSTPQIVKLDSDQISCWNLFRRFFGFGPLAHLKLSLREISLYLNQYDWQAIGRDNNETNQYRAYLKVCTIANKALLSNRSMTLFENVGSEQTIKLSLNSFLDGRLTNSSCVIQKMKWNPLLESKVLKKYLTQKYPQTEFRILDSENLMVNSSQRISLNLLKDLRILADQRISTIPPQTIQDKIFEENLRLKLLQRVHNMSHAPRKT